MVLDTSFRGPGDNANANDNGNAVSPQVLPLMEAAWESFRASWAMWAGFGIALCYAAKALYDMFRLISRHWKALEDVLVRENQASTLRPLADWIHAICQDSPWVLYNMAVSSLMVSAVGLQWMYRMHSSSILHATR
jgi:hypothetical protein